MFFKPNLHVLIINIKICADLPCVPSVIPLYAPAGFHLQRQIKPLVLCTIQRLLQATSLSGMSTVSICRLAFFCRYKNSIMRRFGVPMSGYLFSQSVPSKSMAKTIGRKFCIVFPMASCMHLFPCSPAHQYRQATNSMCKMMIACLRVKSFPTPPCFYMPSASCIISSLRPRQATNCYLHTS